MKTIKATREECDEKFLAKAVVDHVVKIDFGNGEALYATSLGLGSPKWFPFPPIEGTNDFYIDQTGTHKTELFNYERN